MSVLGKPVLLFVKEDEEWHVVKKGHPCPYTSHKTLTHILEKLEIIMSQGTSAQQALADLTAAVQQISQTEASILTAQQSLDAAIQVLIAAKNAGTGVDPAAIESLVGQLNTANTSLQSALTDINNQTAAANPPAAQ